MLNINEIRSNTPGCAHVIHFNNAGASLVSNTTLQSQIEYLNEESIYGGYETAGKYADELNTFYSEIADLINASPDEIAFTDSATTAWERAFFSIAYNSGDEIITDSNAYASNYIAYLQAKRRFGVKIIIIPSGVNGEIDLDKLESSINENTRLISITHIPTNNGLVNPAEKIGVIAKKHDIYYLLDACQSIGQYPLDVNKIHCDFLTATGRKYLRGPRGTGFLYVNSKKIKEFVPFSLDLHSAEWTSKDGYTTRIDARKFETWESNLAAKKGLTSAVKQLNTLGINQVWQRIVELSAYLRNELTTIREVELLDIGRVKCGIVTLRANHSPKKIKEELHKLNINTTVAVKSGTLIDMENRNLDSVLRVSVHYYNTEEEINTFVNSLRQILHKT